MGKEFDKNIKEKLEGLHINYDDASWDSFEQKLDNAMSQEEIEDWQELSTRIDHDNELANRIYLFKIIELVILVLLAYSFFQIEPIKKPGKNIPLYAHSEIFKSIVADKVLDKVVNNNTVVQDNLSKTAALRSTILVIRANEVLQLNYDNRTALVPLDIEDLDLAPISSSTLPQTYNTISSLEHKGVDHDLANLDLVGKINQRDLLAINILNDKASTDLIMPPAYVRKEKSRWLSLSSSADVNLVNTPPRNILSGTDNLLGAAGVSAAMTYAVKSGKNEFQIGLGYSYKDYDPDLVDVRYLLITADMS